MRRPGEHEAGIEGEPSCRAGRELEGKGLEGRQGSLSGQERVTTARDREKKQLEEIAHLYFTGAKKPSRESPPPVKDLSGDPCGSLSRLLWVCCRAGRGEEGWAFPFLMNLAVLLQILDEPVLWVPSNSCRRAEYRHSMASWGSKLGSVAVAGMPGVYYGPMGIQCLVSEESERPQEGSGGQPGRKGWGPEALSRFRYVFCSHPVGLLPWETLPRLDIFLLGPTTREGVPPSQLKEQRSGTRHQAGVVVAGVEDAREGEAVFRNWKGNLDRHHACTIEPESLGFLPGQLPGSGAGRAQRITVLESPLSWQTRCLQLIASRVRLRRIEMMQGQKVDSVPNMSCG